MTHYHLINRATGDECFVQSLDGYALKEWVITELDREPGHHDDLVDGRLAHNAERAATADLETEATLMSPGGMLGLIRRLEDRIAKLEQ